MDRRLKIALVSPYDYPYPGGVTEHITALDEHLRALGHDTRIIAASSATRAELDDHVIKVSGAIAAVTLGGARARVAYSPQVYPRIKRILREEKFDIVHIHEPIVPVLSMSALHHSRAIKVGTFHAYRESISWYDLVRPLTLRAFNQLDGRIFVSPAAREFATCFFPGDSVVIPNGIDISRFGSTHIEPVSQFNDGRPNILFVGRLDERKGFRHLLRAFPYIKNEFPEARLLVVGAFDERDKAPLLRYVRTHHVQDIHFIGRVTPEDLPSYYRTATLFCAPSIGAESFGIVLLEAMAAGVPIIASDIPGYRSVIEGDRGGFLVKRSDEQAIAHAAITLLGDPARRAQMNERGKRIAAQYDWDIIAPRVLDYYHQLISSHHAQNARRANRRRPFYWSRLRRSLRTIGL